LILQKRKQIKEIISLIEKEEKNIDFNSSEINNKTPKNIIIKNKNKKRNIIKELNTEENNKNNNVQIYKKIQKKY